jgi:N-terminal acetyltransferase B complex catalytic subunit
MITILTFAFANLHFIFISSSSLSITLRFQYFSTWPDYFTASAAPDGSIQGYVMGKAEGYGDQWHGHVTAVTVAPEYRRLGLAGSLMESLESVSEFAYNGLFVDLFVRESNSLAIGMYRSLGYTTYKTVLGYYSDNGENALDMRKALARDVEKKSVVPLSHPVRAEDLFED